MPKILLIDDFHEYLHQSMQGNFDVIDCRDCTPNEVAGLLNLHQPEGLFVRSKVFIDKELMVASGGLKWIGRGGAGMDNIDEVSAQEMGIVCFNAGEANSDAVGEHTLAMLLGLLTRLPKANSEVKTGIWDREGNRGTELKGKTVGIVGYGNTGSAVAEKLRGFGVEILAYDKYKTGFGNQWVSEVSEAELLSKSDVISLHIPLTTETRNWINKNRLEQCKMGIYLLNLSRGMTVDLMAVEEAIESSRILGFAADVLPVEPPWKDLDENRKQAFERLMELNHTIFSPHVGGWTVESYCKISVILFDKMLKLYDIDGNF